MPPAGRLSKIRFGKLFSAEEANELIPRLEILLRDLQMAAAALRNRMDELAESDRTIQGPELRKLVARHPELAELARRIADAAEQVGSLGCLLKDIEQGLVDFPHDAGGGNIVFLCWQFGEPQIVAWHSIDGGFAGRKPLPGVAKPYLN